MYGHLKNNQYKPRLIDRHIEEDLRVFGGVCIQGPKYCGKTWTGRSFAYSEVNLMDPAGGFQNRETAELDPDLVLHGQSPRLIDEWQEVPALWVVLDIGFHGVARHCHALLGVGAIAPARQA